jgi:hypothetical protein
MIVPIAAYPDAHTVKLRKYSTFKNDFALRECRPRRVNLEGDRKYHTAQELSSSNDLWRPRVCLRHKGCSVLKYAPDPA